MARIIARSTTQLDEKVDENLTQDLTINLMHTWERKTIRETGFVALVHSLGYADALRFLAQISSGQGDYLEWQEQIFGDASVDEIYEQARKHWEERNEEGARRRD